MNALKRLLGSHVRSRKEMESDEDMLLKRLAEYTGIASAQECRDAVERMRPKKPLEGDWLGDIQCPYCMRIVRRSEAPRCCSWCGQRLDWTEVQG